MQINGRAPGFCRIDGASEKVNAGYTGVEYLNSNNAVGAKIDWQIVAGEAKTYTVEIRYANGGTTIRRADINLNGTKAVTLNFAATGPWTTWQVVSSPLTLVKGKNNISLSALGAEGHANIDYIRVSNGPALPGDCTDAPVPPDPVVEPGDSFALGAAIYTKSCASCHGADGKGGTTNRPMVKCNLCDSADAMKEYIAVEMPKFEPGSCSGKCAADVTTYILQKFNATAPIVDADTLGKVRVWRLTTQEYKNSLAQLFKLPKTYAWKEAPADRDHEDYFHNASDFLQTDVTTARYFMEQSDAVVWGLTDAQLTTLIGCTPTLATCVQDFATNFARQAFRRPVTATDASLYADLAAGSTGLERYRRIAFGVLNSPYFLYRTEMGTEAAIGAKQVTLTDHEIASLLSYTLLGEAPSGDLLAAANAGTLANAAAIERFVTQLVALPQATDRLHRFLRGWLLLDQDNWKDVARDTDTCSQFDSMKGALDTEFQSFLTANATMANGFSNLLTAKFPLPTGPLRTFYESGNDPAGLGPLRQGVLASGMFAANQARHLRPSPVRRGVFIRERLLCQDFTAPSDVPALMETGLPSTVVTNRHLYQAHTSNPNCASCHQYFDPLGFTMENIDACGRYRSLDNGQIVDSMGAILGTSFDTPVTHIDELSNMLAKQFQVRQCFASHAFQFYRGMPESEKPEALIDEIAKSLETKDSFRDLLVQLLVKDQLLARKR